MLKLKLDQNVHQGAILSMKVIKGNLALVLAKSTQAS